MRGSADQRGVQARADVIAQNTWRAYRRGAAGFRLEAVLHRRTLEASLS
jgi:hypothetical protein